MIILAVGIVSMPLYMYKQYQQVIVSPKFFTKD
jgi:hypothetical protein